MSQVFRKGLVIDVLCNLSDVNRYESLDSYKSLVTDKRLQAFPRNTAIIKDITKGAARTANTKTVCYPFFSSHLAMPLKPGEVVWFIYEDPDDPGEIAYWISRLIGPSHVEDTNFAFYSRAFKQNPDEAEDTSSDKFDAGIEGVTLDVGEVQTFSYLSPTADPAEMLNIINSVTKRIHRFEAVPRYSKRPGDLVLQGSNNTLIMLGEERGQAGESAEDILFTANKASIPNDSGAIDIVVGRGRTSGTSGTTITNELGLLETNKRKKSTYDTEGDPHFYADAARVYLTANSSDVGATQHPDSMLNVTLPSNKGFPANSYGVGSFAVIKADNLRIIGRGNAGTIKIVKEPTGSKTDGAAIIMHNNGKMQLAAKKISLSSYRAGQGSQPYVRYDELVSLIDSIFDDLVSFSATLITHVTPGFGAPSPQITSAANSLFAAIAEKKTYLQLGAVKKSDGTAKSLGSVIIYGE